MAVESFMQIDIKGNMQTGVYSSEQGSNSRKPFDLFGQADFKSVLSSKRVNNLNAHASKRTADNPEEKKTSLNDIYSFSEALYALVSQNEWVLAGQKEDTNTDGSRIGDLEAVQHASSKIKYDEVLNRLASVLGLNSNEFAYLMKNSQISLEELADVYNAPHIARKIADMAGLDPIQEQVLAQKIIEAFCKASDEQHFIELSSGMENKSMEMHNAIIAAVLDQKQEGAEQNDAVIGHEPNNLHDLEAMLQEITSSLKEIIHEKGAGAGTEKGYETVTSEAGGIYPENKTANAENGSMTGSLKEGVSEKEEELKIEEFVQTNDSKPNDTMHEVFESVNLKRTEENNGFIIPDSAFNMHDTGIENADGAHSYSFAGGKPEMDILNQVLDKAKVIQLGEKTEIEMYLKPDNLGELSLKITSENGILTAGFVTENHQVRQVLESNIHILRDALERQGLAVQEFNVTVREDNKHPNHGETAYRRPKLVSFEKSAAVGETGVYDLWTLESPLGANLYGLSDNTLDIFA